MISLSKSDGWGKHATVWVLQLTGCAGCEVSLLNAEEWLEEYEPVYMPLVISANSIPDVDILLVSGGVPTRTSIGCAVPSLTPGRWWPSAPVPYPVVWPVWPQMADLPDFGVSSNYNPRNTSMYSCGYNFYLP
jgi:hypothetical protein